ncbi:MAG: HEAT repeat domain-containing protein, partial [Gemmataceae bacterium]
LSADQIFEQRLQASEDDLRRELCDVPELRLLDDDYVRDFRAKEKIARRDTRTNTRQAMNATRKRVPMCVQADPLGAVDSRVRAAIAKEERCVRAAVAAEQRYIRAAIAKEQKRERVAVIVAADEQVVYEFNQSLQQRMRQAARRAGLALQSGSRCQLAPNVAAGVAQLSKDLRELGFVTALAAPSASRSVAAPAELDDIEGSTAKKTRAFQKWCDQHRVERLSGTAPTLMQMLQIEDEPTRLLLVRELTRIKRTASTVELAERAVMDLSPRVRGAAVAALSERSARQYVPILTRALRYPWPPVADHAAVALRTLKPQEAVAPLVELLDLPSPSLPVLDARTNRYSVRELVRLNHLRNCLLCHAASANKEDGLVRGLVPTPGTPLRSSAGSGGSYYSGEGDSVRADITYLHQDFSVVLLDKEAAPWPPRQRYDFVTRLQTVSPDVAAERSASSANYPQREAVKYALRGITGKDGGDSSAKWGQLLGIARDNTTRERGSGASLGLSPAPD